MDFLSKYNLTPAKVAKIVFIGIGLVILLALLLSVVTSFTKQGGGTFSIGGSIPSASVAYDSYANYGESSVSYGGSAGKTLSTRNVMPIIPPRGGTTDNDAEAYEVTDYSARFETRNTAKTCGEIKELKSLSYVIFESTSESDRQCYFNFKVEHENVDEILSTVKSMDPKDFTENIQTIKRQIDDFTSETEILEKKRDSIDRTLTNALLAYDEITALATRTQNADALAKIIDSKIGIIERLTQERININAQLDQLERAKSDQLDRLKYTFFNVSVYENKFFDGENLADSWKASFKSLINTISSVLQSVTIGLAGFLLWLLPILLYIFIAVLLAKYAWKAVKYIWTK